MSIAAIPEPATRHRLFLALRPDVSACRQITHLLTGQRGLIPAANWHLTLRFFGTLNVEQYAVLSQFLGTESFCGGEWQGQRLGPFPPDTSSRLLALQGDCPPWLQRLIIQLDSGLGRLGFAPRDFSFLPHISLLHRQGNLMGAEIQTLERGIPMVLRQMVLYASLQNDKGVYYTPLQTFRLI
jgi:2'-5' RNA ligase